MLTLGRTDLTEEEHLDIVRQKTAGLFASCAYAGGLLAGAPSEVCDALERYGRPGDDLPFARRRADLAGTPRNGVIARDVEQQDEPGHLLRPAHRPRGRPVLRRRARPGAGCWLSRRAGLRRGVTRRYAAEAQSALEALPPSEDRDRLSALAEFAAIRRR